jgi:hypothetical protein
MRLDGVAPDLERGLRARGGSDEERRRDGRHRPSEPVDFLDAEESQEILS